MVICILIEELIVPELFQVGDESLQSLADVCHGHIGCSAGDFSKTLYGLYAENNCVRSKNAVSTVIVKSSEARKALLARDYQDDLET